MSDKPTFEIVLPNVRLSFAHIFKAQEPREAGGTAKFNCSFLIPKNTPEGKALREKIKTTVQAAAKAKWGDSIPKLKPEKLCCRDGDLESYDGYAGHWYLSASNSKRPTIVDRNRKPLVEADGKPFSGCYVTGIVRIWCQDNKFGQRINASLEGIQYVREGEAFGSKPLSEDAFEDLGDGEFTDGPAFNREDLDDEIPF